LQRKLAPMTLPSLARLVLVPDLRSARAPESAPVRRYRLARVPASAGAGAGRFDHLKKTYD
jgi:hypothetical protein